MLDLGATGTGLASLDLLYGSTREGLQGFATTANFRQKVVFLRKYTRHLSTIANSYLWISVFECFVSVLTRGSPL